MLRTSPSAQIFGRAAAARIMAALLFALLAACNDGPLEPVPVAWIEVSPAETHLLVGDTRELRATAKATDGRTLSGRQVTWSSGDQTIATVSASGIVTARKAGVTLITAVSEGKTAQARIAVHTPFVPVASVRIAPDSAVLQVSAYRQLDATVHAADGSVLEGRFVTWSSDDPLIAAVESGYVAGRRAGVTWITATSEGKTARAKVIVRPAAEYHLRTANGNALPTEVFATTYTDDNGVVRHLRAVVTDGILRLTEDGYYEQSVMRIFYEDDVRVGQNSYYDRGRFTVEGDGELRFTSTGVVNRAGSGRYTGEAGLSLRQRVVEEGPEVTFVYERQ